MFLGNPSLLFDRCLVDCSQQFRLPVLTATAERKAAGNASTDRRARAAALDLLYFALDLQFFLSIECPSLLKFP
jgi:hypothetical protein